MVTPIDPYIASWRTKEGFIKLFYSMCSEHPGRSQEFAYEQAERMFMAQFGERRYSSWECFKETKNRDVRKKTTLLP